MPKASKNLKRLLIKTDLYEVLNKDNLKLEYFYLCLIRFLKAVKLDREGRQASKPLFLFFLCQNGIEGGYRKAQEVRFVVVKKGKTSYASIK